MNGHQRANHLKYSLILAMGLGVAQIAGAVALGPIVGVNSHMGQPLSASIRVDSLSKEQAQSATVSLAGADEYRKRGIRRLPIHDQLRFRLVPSGNGYRIQVTSSGSIGEPFVNFLLTINVGGEKQTREYALFLNNAEGGSTPPASAPESAGSNVSGGATVAAPPATPPSTPTPPTTPAPTTDTLALGVGDNNLIGQAHPSNIPPATTAQEGWGGNVATGQRVALANQPQTPPSVDGASGKYTVKSGDTLFRIAQAATPRGGNVNAMMQAIKRANPHAFGNANMNSLKAGAVLTIPGNAAAIAESAEQVAATPPRPRRGEKRNTPPAQTPPAVAQTPPQEEIAQTPPAESAQEGQTDTAPPPVDDETSTGSITAQVVPPSTGETFPDPVLEGNAQLAPPQTDPATPSGMDTTLTLDGMDELQPNTLPEGQLTSPDVAIVGGLPQPDAPLEVPPTADPAVQLPPPVSEPVTPPAQDIRDSVTSTTTPATTAPASHFGIELPFGLQLWHLLLAGGLLITGILLALLMKARGKRKHSDEAYDNMSPAEIDRMVAEMEDDSALQHSLASQLNELDDLSYEALSQSRETPAKISRPAQNALEEERERLKARMAELDALQQMETEKSLAQTATEAASTTVPAFELHLGGHAAQPDSATAAQTSAGSNLFDDWNFHGNESAVQTSADETNVDDFFNVDERLEDIIKPASAPRGTVAATPAHTAAQSAAVAAAVMEPDPERIEAMEINLDLATSFIATGNASRARIWLEEVLLEGSSTQKALAAQLLTKVDAQK